MATVAVPNKTKLTGGSFLTEEHATDKVFTPEDFTEEHRQIAQTTNEFTRNEVLPNAEKIEHKNFAVTAGLLRKAGETRADAAWTFRRRTAARRWTR